MTTRQTLPKQIRLFVVFMLLSAALSYGIVAQGAPDAIQDALADLNQRLGLNLTINDLNWSWRQDRFDDNALGCPTDDETPSPDTIVGYEFEFTWAEEVYTYRVSADRSIVRLCGVRGIDEAPELTEEEARERALERSNVLCPTPPEDISFMRTRLSTGIQAQVIAGLPNNVRAQPSTDAEIIGEIPGQGVFRVVAGPTCTDDGTLWWQINYGTLSGYTAEGRNGEYFVRPEAPRSIATDATRPVISSDNLGLVSEATRLYGNFSGGLAWSPEFTLVATGNAGSEGLWVYPVDRFTEPPTIIESNDRFTRATFATSDQVDELAVLGDDEGSVRMWNVSLDGTLVERAVLNGHNDPVTAVAISEDGGTIASVGGLAFINLDDEATRRNAIVLWDTSSVAQIGGLVGHQDRVTGLAFNLNGTRLVSTSFDGTVRLWDVTTRTQVGIIEGEVPVTALAWSADESRILVGYEDGTISLVNPYGFEIETTLTGHGGILRAIAFSPDNTVAATVGADSRLILWDVASLLTDEPVQVIPTTTDSGEFQNVVFSADGTYIATLQGNNLIRIWQPTATVG